MASSTPTRPSSRSSGAVRKTAGWWERLRLFAFSTLGQPWTWGLTDCHAYALRALDAMTEGDHASLAVLRYHDVRGALALMRELGTFDAYMARHGAEQVSRATFGDFAYYDLPHWRHSLTPGLVIGPDQVIVTVADRLRVVPLEGPGPVVRIDRCPKPLS